MEAQPFKIASDGTSKSLFDLNLPEVAPGEEPLSLPEPSYELAREHALFLLRSGGNNHRPLPNPEPFVMD